MAYIEGDMNRAMIPELESKLFVDKQFLYESIIANNPYGVYNNLGLMGHPLINTEAEAIQKIMEYDAQGKTDMVYRALNVEYIFGTSYPELDQAVRNLRERTKRTPEYKIAPAIVAGLMGMVTTVGGWIQGSGSDSALYSPTLDSANRPKQSLPVWAWVLIGLAIALVLFFVIRAIVKMRK